MTEKNVKVGLIGCGRMGTAHVEALNRLGTAEIVGVYDIDMPKAEKFAERYGAKKVCTSRAELLSDCGVELLLICDYGHQHADELHAAMDAGIRSIFCEKPVIRQLDEAAGLLKKQAETGTLIAVGHVRRVFPDQLKMKEILDSGILGRIHFCRIQSCVATFKQTAEGYFGNFARSGGCTLDMATHFIDMLNWYFGRPLAAGGANVGLERTLLPEEKRCDYVSGFVRYAGDIVCGIDVSYQCHGVGRTYMEIYGENGTMLCEGSAVSVVTNDYRTAYNIPAADVHADQMDLMLKMTTDRIQPPCTLKDGILSAATALCMMDPNPGFADFVKGL